MFHGWWDSQAAAAGRLDAWPPWPASAAATPAVAAATVTFACAAATAGHKASARHGRLGAGDPMGSLGKSWNFPELSQKLVSLSPSAVDFQMVTI